MVVGENPEEIMENYSTTLKVEPYIKYRYVDAKKIRDKAISMFSELLKNAQKYSLSDEQKSLIEEKYKAISAMSPFEYYSSITYGMYYDEDGNATTDENPNGKWVKYHIGQGFSYPLTLKDGTEKYSAKKGEIDWDAMHMNKFSVNYFHKVWSLCKDDSEPENDEEAALKATWSTKKNYLSNFKSEEAFINHNCSYWNYAYVDENGWVDLDDFGDDSKWVANFYKKFVKPLPDDALVTIYEFSNVD
jgi:hypothetical protein